MVKMRMRWKKRRKRRRRRCEGRWGVHMSTTKGGGNKQRTE